MSHSSLLGDSKYLEENSKYPEDNISQPNRYFLVTLLPLSISPLQMKATEHLGLILMNYPMMASLWFQMSLNSKNALGVAKVIGKTLHFVAYTYLP